MAKIRTLRRCPLFRHLGYRDLAILAPYVKEEAAKADTMLTEEGQTAQGLIVIKSGRVKLLATAAGTADLELSSGDFFGELSLWNGSQPRAVSARAIEACEYLRIGPTDFQALYRKAPDVAGKVSHGVVIALSQKMDAARSFLSEVLGT